MTVTGKIRPEDNPALQHGKYSTYSNHGCRCDACREAHRNYQNSYMARNAKQRHLAVLRSRIRYWRREAEAREYLRKHKPEKYDREHSVTAAKRSLAEAIEAHAKVKRSSDSEWSEWLDDRTSE